MHIQLITGISIDNLHVCPLSRYFTSGWVKEVHFHPISNTSPVVFLAAKVMPSMRLSAVAYEAWAAIERDTLSTLGGKIVGAYCTCTAG